MRLVDLALSGRCLIRLLLVDVEHIPARFHVQVHVILSCGWRVLTRLVRWLLRAAYRRAQILIG